MQNFMFKSRTGALAFAALVVVGAMALVGAEEEPGTVVKTSDTIADRRAEFVQRMEDENASVDRFDDAEDSDEEALEADWDEEDDYLSDEELVDAATGIDPNPADASRDDSGSPVEG